MPWERGCQQPAAESGVNDYAYSLTQTQNRPQSPYDFDHFEFISLGPYDSLFDSDHVFRRPGPPLIEWHGHCQIGYRS